MEWDRCVGKAFATFSPHIMYAFFFFAVIGDPGNYLFTAFPPNFLIPEFVIWVNMEFSQSQVNVMEHHSMGIFFFKWDVHTLCIQDDLH